MKKHIDFNEALEQFTQDINNKFSVFDTYANIYSFWLHDKETSALGIEYYKKRQDLLNPYKVVGEADSILFITGTEDEFPKEYDFSHIKDIEMLEVSQKLDMLDAETLFDRVIHKIVWYNKKNVASCSIRDIWAFYIWKYFIQDKRIFHSIFTVSDSEEMISVDGKSFCDACDKYRGKYGLDSIKLKGQIEKRLRKLAKINSYITETTEGNFCYPKSMQEALIECVSICYDDKKREYPYKALEVVGERIQKDSEALEERRKRREIAASSSKRKLIASWRDNVRYYSFDTFTEANRRLFLESEAKMQTADSWDRLTGSLLTNSIYRTFRGVDERCRFIASRMDDDVLEALYFCIEKLFEIKNLNHIEKAKFISRMFSVLPLFMKKEKNWKKVLQSLGDAIRDFGIDDWYNIYVDELNKTGLLNDKEAVDEIAKQMIKGNETFVKLWAENQKEDGDSYKNKNTIFFRRFPERFCITYMPERDLIKHKKCDGRFRRIFYFSSGVFATAKSLKSLEKWEAEGYTGRKTGRKIFEKGDRIWILVITVFGMMEKEY